jgi:hypothetical protein
MILCETSLFTVKGRSQPILISSMLRSMIHRFFYTSPQAHTHPTLDTPTTYYDPMQHNIVPIPDYALSLLCQGKYMEGHVIDKMRTQSSGKILCKIKNNQPFIIRWQPLYLDTPLVHSDCVICMDNPIDVMFYPCAHMQCCQKCAVKLVCHWTGATAPTCPMCRSEIHVILNIS